MGRNATRLKPRPVREGGGAGLGGSGLALRARAFSEGLARGGLDIGCVFFNFIIYGEETDCDCVSGCADYPV